MLFFSHIYSFLLTACLGFLSLFDRSTVHLRRNLLAYPLSSTPQFAPFTTVINPQAAMTSNQKLKLVKDFKNRVQLDGIAFFESQRKRTDSVNIVNVIKGTTSKTNTATVKEDPTIAVSSYYLPKVVTSATCTGDGTGYSCVPNKEKWTSNPGNFAFLYYNSMEECVASGQPFYFYSEMQTSCTAGIRQSCDKFSKSVTVKSYANLDCTGSVTTKYTYSLSSGSYPSGTDFTLCHDSPYSAGTVRAVCV